MLVASFAMVSAQGTVETPSPRAIDAATNYFDGCQDHLFEFRVPELNRAYAFHGGECGGSILVHIEMQGCYRFAPECKLGTSTRTTENKARAGVRIFRDGERASLCEAQLGSFDDSFDSFDVACSVSHDLWAGQSFGFVASYDTNEVAADFRYSLTIIYKADPSPTGR